MKRIKSDWKELCDIPNQVGFRLVVLLRSGNQVAARVVKGGDGCHSLENVKYSDCVAWKNL